MFLRESMSSHTLCKRFDCAWPDIIGITDASSFGVGSIIIGEHLPLSPMVFQLLLHPEVPQAVMSTTNPTGSITNSDL
jgi:hypothetical protein